MASLAEFRSPPVVEVVLGVQFDALQDFSTAHSGWFWRTRLDQRWRSAKDAPRLDDQFERFDEGMFLREPPFRVRPPGTPERTQLFHEDEQRMIQIQDTRFVYNWRKREMAYPTYERLVPEFLDCYSRFSDFVREAGLGALSLNQWEVVYVNHIPMGSLWHEPSEWPRVLPGLQIPSAAVPGQRFDSFGGEWHYVLGDNEGRLRVSIRHGRAFSGSVLLVVTLTARGPLKQQSPEVGFAVGHKAIVQTFLSMTSQAAHAAWERVG